MRTEVADPVTDPAPSRDAPRRVESDTSAFQAFVIAEVAGACLYLFLGRHIWFWFDEWYFIASRDVSVHGLLDPHFSHLVALPVLVYRGMYSIVGLRSYRPYQAMTIGLHLVAAALIRTIIRRLGVNPWIATSAAVLFIFFGAASQDILWAFQITFSGSLVFGLTQLLLLDHDGPFDRRDWLALVAGLAAILCSDLGVPMVIAAGVFALLRRGWRVAALQTAPLGILFLLWQHFYGDVVRTGGARDVLRVAQRRGSESLRALIQQPFAEWFLLALLVVGLSMAWLSWSASQRRSNTAYPAALMVGTATFLLLSSVLHGGPFASTYVSRYFHIVGALMLPVLALAADAVVRRWRVLLPFAMAVFLVGIYPNLERTSDAFLAPSWFSNFGWEMRSLPSNALAGQVSPDMHPFPNEAPQVTLRWLLNASRNGRLPKHGNITPEQYATDTLLLGLAETTQDLGRTCPALPPSSIVVLRRGESLEVRGSMLAQLVSVNDKTLSFPAYFGLSFLGGAGPHTVTADVEALRLRIRPTSPRASAC